MPHDWPLRGASWFVPGQRRTRCSNTHTQPPPCCPAKRPTATRFRGTTNVRLTLADQLAVRLCDPLPPPRRRRQFPPEGSVRHDRVLFVPDLGPIRCAGALPDPRLDTRQSPGRCHTLATPGRSIRQGHSSASVSTAGTPETSSTSVSRADQTLRPAEQHPTLVGRGAAFLLSALARTYESDHWPHQRRRHDHRDPRSKPKEP